MSNARARHPNDIEDSLVHLAWSRARNAALFARSMVASVESRSTVALVHFGRSGSTVLGQTLAAQSEVDVLWDGEVFQKLHRDEQLMLRLARDPFRFLDWRSKRSLDVYGYEIKVNPGAHLDLHLGLTPTEFVHNATARNHCVVYLRRPNLVRWVLSNVSARQRGSYHTTVDANTESIELPIVAPRVYGAGVDLRQYLERARVRDVAMLDALDGDSRHLTIDFGSQVSPDPNIAAARILDHLCPQVEYRHVVPRLRPTVGHRPLASALSNYVEIEQHLAGTEFESLLDD